jgi:hypothetical protein
VKSNWTFYYLFIDRTLNTDTATAQGLNLRKNFLSLDWQLVVSEGIKKIVISWGIKKLGVVSRGITVWETIFFKHSPKWRVDWNKYLPKWNRVCHVWRRTFFLNSPTICNKYQINNTVMFNNLFCRFWQVINLVKKDQHSLKSCVDLFFLNFEFRCLRLLSFNARYKTCMSNPVPTHI